MTSYICLTCGRAGAHGYLTCTENLRADNEALRSQLTAQARRVGELERRIESMQQDYAVNCARCGKALMVSEACIEEGDEWECPPCNERENAREDAENANERGRYTTEPATVMLNDINSLPAKTGAQGAGVSNTDVGLLARLHDQLRDIIWTATEVESGSRLTSAQVSVISLAATALHDLSEALSQPNGAQEGGS